jgi:hypothetical protein
MLAKRASTWPRDHYCCKAPRSSWPTIWNEFLPISMPTTETAALNVILPSILLLVGQEHGRTIPLADMANFRERVGKHRRGGRNCGYSPDSIVRRRRKRILSSLLVSEITKRTRPWPEVSA